MSKTLSRVAALEEISNWSISDVLTILRKNGLDDCCKAVHKRQVDGDEFLHLTEGKLALWKSDLTRPLAWSLWRFVEDLKKSPEKYILEKNSAECTQSEELMSDSGSWGTDFEDDVEDEDDGNSRVDSSNNNNKNDNDNKISDTSVVQGSSQNLEFRNSLMLFRENEKTSKLQVENNQTSTANEKPASFRSSINKEIVESTYTNSETEIDDGSVYANFSGKLESKSVVKAPTNVSNLHGKFDKSLAEQLREKLRLRNARKPTIGPKPEIAKKEISPIRKKPQKSFLHDVIPTLVQNQQSNFTDRTSLNSSSASTSSVEMEKSQIIVENDLPRPPLTIRNFDLVANLPTRTDESDDEYEPFDEQIIELNKRLSIGRVDSKQSLNSARQNSLESVYKTPSTTSQEKQDDEDYEIYESITETPEDNGYYLRPIEKGKILPPPLPAKPTISPSPTPVRSGLMENKNERSPDKKSATLPHSGSGTSLTTESRATRPLPPPPDKQSYMDLPWFHNITREQATALIKDRAYGNSQNGYFLLRPSSSHPNNPLALVLWFKDRVYNVPVRKRPDNRYALGSAKTNEQAFCSVEEIVKFYSREELVLHTGGVQTGSTKLTDTPPK